MPPSLAREAAAQTAKEANPDDAAGSAAERSLRLLSLLAREGRALGLAELAVRLGLPKTSVHRMCNQLMAAGWLARDVDERHFAVGPALHRLALDTLNHGALRGLRREVLAALVTEVGETCNFTTLDGAQVLYIDRVEAKWPLRLSLEVGSHVPLHCTASGKLFLAHLPVARRRQMLGTLNLEPMTRRTLTSAAALQAECRRIVQAGCATDDEEFMAGLVAVAVPVQEAGGQVRAAIAVHAPVARMSLQDALARLPALQRAAKRMSALL